jgi:hypothetical protein
MFIQVIEGKTNDPEALHERLQIWERDLMPGAIGYLGSTGGCTESGDCILVARFESREAAQRNSDRPEQTEWWEGTEDCFDGIVTFHDSEEVQVMEHGNLDQARFVQVMDGHVTDRDRALKLEQESEPMLADVRPDLLGAVTAFYGDEFTEMAYFTSEAEAREAEKRPMPDEAATAMADWERTMKVDRYMDIPDPWIVSR